MTEVSAQSDIRSKVLVAPTQQLSHVFILNAEKKQHQHKQVLLYFYFFFLPSFWCRKERNCMCQSMFSLIIQTKKNKHLHIRVQCIEICVCVSCFSPFRSFFPAALLAFSPTAISSKFHNLVSTRKYMAFFVGMSI